MIRPLNSETSSLAITTKCNKVEQPLILAPLVSQAQRAGILVTNDEIPLSTL